ncbi:MAG TPA: hypothetical protein ENI15_08650 [Spirochaetes bacterium]|nr:hypothetical protein [Spirochaetota bacterium]
MLKFFCFIAPLLLIPSLLTSATLSNKHLLVDVEEETARIFISTIDGKEDVEGDERINLLFFDKPPSSYTVLYVHRDAITFGGGRGIYIKRPVAIGDKIETIWEDKTVNVKQVVEFVKRKNTRTEDGVLITYTIKNISKYSRTVGLRILFDTSLGEKGIYHFELPTGEQIRYETEYLGDDQPRAWISKDTKRNPQHILRGVIRGELVTTPDKIVFANYKSLFENLFSYRIRRKRKFDYPPYSRNDSAVAIYFVPYDLDPGETREYSTVLGLSGEEEYGEDVVEIIQIEEEPGVIEEIIEKPEEIKLKENIDLDLLNEELERIKRIRELIAEENRLMEEMNRILEIENNILKEEELNRLKEALDAIDEIRKNADQ